jgi:hypothetical protein
LKRALEAENKTDASLAKLYRAYVLWDRSILAVSLPLLTWLSFIGIAITGNLVCTPVVPPVEAMTRVVVAYYALSVATNALCTLLIVGKIMIHQQRMRRSGIQKDTSYTFVSNVMAESGFWYAASGIVNAILIAREDDLQTVSVAVFGAMAVSPYIYILWSQLHH